MSDGVVSDRELRLRLVQIAQKLKARPQIDVEIAPGERARHLQNLASMIEALDGTQNIGRRPVENNTLGTQDAERETEEPHYNK
jgi:hypothetical protein